MPADTSTKQGSVVSSDTTAIPKKSTFLSLYYGVSNYLGDLGGNSGYGKHFIFDNNFKKRTTFVGVSFSYLRKNVAGLRLSYISGKIAGADHDASYKDRMDDAYTRFKRNLDFQTKINEWSLIGELFPLKLLNQKRKAYRWNMQPYLLAGVGRYKFNPQGSYYDEISTDYVWVDLAYLSTEGQGMQEYPDRKPYKLSQWNLPYGFGIRYALGFKTSLSVEYVGRKLFTDYLDDVSTNFIDPTLFSKYLDQEDAEIAQAVNNKSNLIEPNSPYKTGEIRGNPKSNDFYYSFNLKFSIQLNKRKDRPAPDLPKKEPTKGKQYKYDSNEICE